MKLLCVCTLSLATLACTDANKASLSSYGERAKVKCYSGGKEIFNSESTGRVNATSQSDRWEFKDSKTNTFVRVSGDCVVETIKD